MWGWDTAGSTPPGSYLQGLAEVVRAQGDYNLSTSAAAVNLTTAARQAIQNNKDYVEAYFAIRAFNRQARDAENVRDRQITQEWLRFHPSVKPKRLTSSELDPVSGSINWPILLQSDELAKRRQAIQQAFTERHHFGVMDYNNYRMVQQITNDLIDELLNKIQEIAPSEYMQAKRFIEALIYEASLPLG
jgi:cytochrome P450